MGQEGGSVLPARKQQLEIAAVGGVFEVTYTLTILIGSLAAVLCCTSLFHLSLSSAVV